jgi:hypothetical protein
MGINPFMPVKDGEGYKMRRKEPTPAERQKFIVSAMKRIVEDGEVIMTADPDRIPSNVFQHADMGIYKCNGTWHLWLDLFTQQVNIGLRYKDYEIQGRDDTQVYMAVRVDLEKIIDVFDNIELKERK